MSLLPCPNPECGNPDVYLDDARETNGSGILFSCCDRCGFRGPNVEFRPGRLEYAEPQAELLHNNMPRVAPWLDLQSEEPMFGAMIEVWEQDSSYPDLYQVCDDDGDDYVKAKPWSAEGGPIALKLRSGYWRYYSEPRRP